VPTKRPPLVVGAPPPISAQYDGNDPAVLDIGIQVLSGAVAIGWTSETARLRPAGSRATNPPLRLAQRRRTDQQIVMLACN
jgi:hypothetical protein